MGDRIIHEAESRSAIAPARKGPPLPHVRRRPSRARLSERRPRTQEHTCRLPASHMICSRMLGRVRCFPSKENPIGCNAVRYLNSQPVENLTRVAGPTPSFLQQARTVTMRSPERLPAANGPPRTNARTSPVPAPRRATSLHSPTRVSTSPLAAPRARASTRGAHASTESPARASTMTLPHSVVTPPPPAVPRKKISTSLDSTETAESDSPARNSPSPQVVWCSPDSSKGSGVKSAAGAKPSAGAKPPAATKATGVKPTAGATNKASRIPVLSPKRPADEKHPTARGAAPHSPPLAAPTGASPLGDGSRPRSSYGSSHRSGFSHRSSPGSSHGSSDLPRPRAEPLLARRGGVKEAGRTPSPALRVVTPATLPSVEPATTRNLSPGARDVSSDAWAILTREVDYAKQRAQRAEKELLELRPRAAGLLAALEQAKRDMADAASVATLRHEEAARQREEERAREQRGEEAHPARSSGPFPSP